MVTPLTKHTKTGTRYKRRAQVESSIATALATDLAEQRRRCSTTDQQSPDYMPSEGIVYLIRDARRRNDEATMNALLPFLLQRCKTILNSRIPASVDRVKYLREEVLGRFAELFAVDGQGNKPDQLDYYECRFNRAFRSLRINVLREEGVITAPLESWPDNLDGAESNDNHSTLSYFEDVLQRPVTAETSALLSELSTAIAALPPDERDAVILCHYLGYQEESDCPEKVTAATLCGVTGRTIRNRLTRAEAKLTKFKEIT